MELRSLLSSRERADRRAAALRAALAGKVVAITGGARGIGLETAQQLLDAGARVAIGDVDADAVGKAAADLGVEGVELDVTDSSSFTSFLDAVEERVGAVDVLINNAGIMPVGAFLEYDEALIRRTVEVDLVGVMLGSRAAARRMVARGRGQIVNVASVAGRLANPGLTVYNGVKAGVIEFSEALDAELVLSGVRVSTVLPTFTHTGLIDGLVTNSMVKAVEPKDIAEQILAVIARPRVRVTAPRSMGWVGVNVILPHAVKRRLRSLTKTDTIFLNPDSSARAGYSARIGQ
ncbi:MAG: SDR family NAD(P)-dependent oxidoreductase [Gordonia sp. (in: high G+C Gram-positive bacteria)]